MLKEFRQFVLRGNVVDLAVGVVIGAAFGSVVNSIVSGMFSPVIALFGDSGLRELTFKVGGAEFEYGVVLDALVQFIVIAAVVFFFVVKPVNHLMERFRTDQPAAEATRECPECTSKIAVRARRCSFCTAAVGAAQA